MSYSVKEIFYTLQGEGANTGRPAVFCRFAGCNLWSGREEDRSDAVCDFCDTDFVGMDGTLGGRYQSADELADTIASEWPEGDGTSQRPEGNVTSHRPEADDGSRFVVCTGGEPLMQMDDAFINALHDRGFTIAIETNGTKPAPDGIDWVCVSPKADAELVQDHGDEMKLVYPQAEPEAQPERFAHLDFNEFYLQPLDGPDAAENLKKSVQYCMDHPRWRLSLQTHKMIGIR